MQKVLEAINKEEAFLIASELINGDFAMTLFPHVMPAILSIEPIMVWNGFPT